MEEKLMDLFPIVSAVVILVGIFLAIMSFKHRGEEDEEEEQDLTKTPSSEDEIKKLLKIKPWRKK